MLSKLGYKQRIIYIFIYIQIYTCLEKSVSVYQDCRGQFKMCRNFPIAYVDHFSCQGNSTMILRTGFREGLWECVYGIIWATLRFLKLYELQCNIVPSRGLRGDRQCASRTVDYGNNCSPRHFHSYYEEATRAENEICVSFRIARNVIVVSFFLFGTKRIFPFVMKNGIFYTDTWKNELKSDCIV